MERPLFWHQGLFLQPQHFQRESRYVHTLLQPYARYLQPFFWGVGELELVDTIVGNTFEKPVRGEFLFQDMTYAVFPGNAIIESRSFDESWLEEGKPFTVYVGLKKWNESGENVTVLSSLENLSDVPTRFVTKADPDEVNDLHQNGPPAHLQRLYYLLKLFGQNEIGNLGDYSLIPLAQLERTGDKIALSERFVPPCLSVTGFSALSNLIREIRDQIAARGYQLESLKQERGIQSAEFGTKDMVFLMALRSLNRYIPMMHHITNDVEKISPCSVYAILKQIAGELSTFSNRINVLGETQEGEHLLPRYDHRNLWKCFSAAQALIVQLLDDITAGPEYRLDLLFDGTYFTTELKPQMLEGNNRYYLVMKTETDPKSVLQAVETSIKLSSREFLPILIARALPGVKLQHLPAPPQELPRLAHGIYFQINHHSDQWAQIEKGRNVGLYWDSAPRDLTVEMMIVGKS